jgi:hypothetical protein
LIRRCIRVYVLRLGSCGLGCCGLGCFRRGPFYRVMPFYRLVEKAQDFRMRVLRHRFDQLAAAQNFQQIPWRRRGREY